MLCLPPPRSRSSTSIFASVLDQANMNLPEKCQVEQDVGTRELQGGAEKNRKISLIRPSQGHANSMRTD